MWTRHTDTCSVQESDLQDYGILLNHHFKFTSSMFVAASGTVLVVSPCFSIKTSSLSPFYQREFLELGEPADLQLVPTINKQNPTERCHGALPSQRQSGVSLLSSSVSDVEPDAHPESETVRLLRGPKESWRKS